MISAIFQQPLAHFLVIGSLIFGVYAVVRTPDPPGTENEIAVSIDTATRLAAVYEQTWQRKPTAEELSGLIDRHIQEEVLVREAKAFALDQDDPVIRQRLSQKMQFLIDSAVARPDPAPGELEKFFHENSNSYVSPAKVSIEQVYLGEQVAGDSIKPVKAALSEGEDFRAIGNRSLLPPTIPLSTKRGVDNVFGDGFWDRLVDARLNEWTGPIQSGYGYHLVRVVERVDETLPPFEKIKDGVLEDWRQQKASQLQQAEIQRLLSLHTMTRPNGADLEKLVR